MMLVTEGDSQMEESEKEKSRKEILEDFLQYHQEVLGGRGLVVGDPELKDEVVLRWLLSAPGIRGVVVHPSLASQMEDWRVGSFLPGEYTWKPPSVPSKIVAYIGPRNQVGLRMVRRVMAINGARFLVSGVPGIWRREHVFSFLGRRVLERASWAGARMTTAVRQRSGAFLPAGLQQKISQARSRFPTRALLGLRRFSKCAKRPLLDKDRFVNGRCILVNSALAWGGAERQLVNTLVQLKAKGIDASLVCEHLNLSDDHRFFHHQLEGVRVDALGTAEISGIGKRMPELKARLISAVQQLPLEIAEDVMRYAAYFLERRPQVMHAWQDETSIKAGLAALLVGVPRIVLSGRNVAPIHFAYYQYYMRPAYRLLAASERVVMLNNSKAGAQDYERWLGIKGIRVVYNGLAENFIKSPSPEEVTAYRESLGIPPNARVVGGIFRLYQEKDPELWLKTAATLFEHDPSLWFLLVGTGPMKEKLAERARKLGIGGRFLLPGTHKKPAIPLSIMDVFLLTSRYEGTPNVLMEAQMMGVPVVATPAGGVGETLVEGRTGKVVEERTPDALARAVRKVLADPEWKKRAERVGPRFIRERFSLDRMIEETLQAYGMARQESERLESVGDQRELLV